MALTPRVSIAFAAYKDLLFDQSLYAQCELEFQLRTMTERETRMYYRLITENRTALARAAEEIEWPTLG